MVNAPSDSAVMLHVMPVPPASMALWYSTVASLGHR